MTKPKGNPYLTLGPKSYRLGNAWKECDHVGTPRKVAMLLFTESKRTNGFYEECVTCGARLSKLRDDEVEYTR